MIQGLQGFLIGLSVLIPGVSGGTMAIVLGIYDALIHAVSTFFQYKKKNAIFLLQIGAGALLGIVLFSRIIAYGVERFHYPMIYMFLGFVCGGIPVLLKKTKTSVSRKRDYIYCAVGFCVALLMMCTPNTLLNIAARPSLSAFLLLFFAGFVIAIALILPGISTSFMLLTLGLYETILKAIQNVDLLIIIPVLLGVFIGTISTTKILERVMHRYPRKTYLLILGFVLGSVIQVFPGIPQGVDALYSVMMFMIGIVAIRLLNRTSKNNN